MIDPEGLEPSTCQIVFIIDYFVVVDDAVFVNKDVRFFMQQHSLIYHVQNTLSVTDKAVIEYYWLVG